MRQLQDLGTRYFDDYLLQLNNMKKFLLFIFDGAYAYSPKRFNAYKTYSGNLSKIPNTLKTKIDKERRRVSYTPVLDLVYGSDYPFTHQIFYSAQTSIKKSIIEIQKIDDIENYEIDIFGYSWGSDASMRFIRVLKKRGIKINNVFTLDPVRRGLFFAGFIKSINSNTKYFKKESNVKKHFNIYQKTDRFSLPLIHLRGNFVEKAESNINLSDIRSDASHVNLHTFKEVQSFLTGYLSSC